MAHLKKDSHKDSSEDKSDDDDDSETNFADQLLQANKRQKTAQDPYISCEFIPATSALAERAFSISGFIFSNERKAMLPINLESRYVPEI